MTRFKGKYRVETTRLPGWDYAAPGWYFVTICTRDRRPFFGRIENGQMHLSPIGQIAHTFWQEIPYHTAGNVSLDAFVAMPNHVHGILVIESSAATKTAETTPINPPAGENTPMAAISPKAGSLGAIIRSYKSAVTRWCRQNGHPEFAWQPRFYDHILRTDQALQRIRRYIQQNPLRWQLDQENLENFWM